MKMTLKNFQKGIWMLAILSQAISCKKEPTSPPKEEPVAPVLLNTVPEFYAPKVAADYGKDTPAFTLIANRSQKISTPQDLDFNPIKPEQLWVLNKGLLSTGGSTVMLTDAGTPVMKYDYRRDGNAYHFMLLPSALAFSSNGDWAISPGTLDANHNGTLYTGPSLWSSDLSIYAMPSGQNGSHLSMVHQSPYSMGIASDTLAVFWTFDGYNRNIVRYDFGTGHEPGGEDHSTGIVRRYTEAKVTRSTIPSHLVLDKKTGWLYVAGTADKKIYRLDTKSGSAYQALTPYAEEPLTEYNEIRGATWEVFADGGMSQPSGIEVKGDRLFVSDYGTGEIIAFDTKSKKELARIKTGKPGILGIKAGPDGKLWYVNASSSEVLRVDPKY